MEVSLAVGKNKQQKGKIAVYIFLFRITNHHNYLVIKVLI